MLKKYLIIVIVTGSFILLNSCSSDDEPKGTSHYSLTLSVSPADAGAVNKSNGMYENGTTVDLSARPNSIYKFKEWSGDATGTFNQIEVIMNKRKSITAVFELKDGEITYVPDDNFEQALIDLGHDDALDDYVLTSNISEITSLDVTSKSISDITGIEDFISLESLDCSNNSITSLNLMKNTALKNLGCSRNQLTAIELSENLHLERLECSENELTTLILSNNSALKYVDCQLNKITSLDLSRNVSLEEMYANNNQVTGIDLTQNDLLRTLNVTSNQLTNLDLGNNLKLETIQCSFNEITNLSVDKNSALTSLTCEANALTSLNINDNTELVNLDCRSNKISELNLSQNLALEILSSSDNELSNLDISQNINLSRLLLDNNKLKTLDASNNSDLELLWCSNNNLISLNIKNGNNDRMFKVHFKSKANKLAAIPPEPVFPNPFIATNNPLLTCIQVDDETKAFNGDKPYVNWLKEEIALYSEDCE